MKQKQLRLSLILLIALLSKTVTLSAQEKSHLHYAEIYEVSTLVGKSVNVNFGIDAPNGMTYKITDETEQHSIEFKNAIAALNYLSAQGWRLVSVYERDMGKAGRRTFYLIEFDSSKYEKTALVKAAEEAVKKYL